MNQSLLSIFPYKETKAEQQKIMDTINNAEGPVMIEAGTGTGKTIATLTALLCRRKKGQKILVFVKTINQMNPILREWSKIFAKFDKDQPLVLPLLGKKRICHLSFVKTRKTVVDCTIPFKNSYQRMQKLDKLGRKNKRQRILRWINWGLQEKASIHHFTSILSSRENCPYYNSRSMIPHADILVMSYGYLKPRQFSRLLAELGCEKKELLVLLDEAHNFAREQISYLSKAHLLGFTRIFKSTDFINSILAEMRGLRLLSWEMLSDDIRSDTKQVLDLAEKARWWLEEGRITRALPKADLEFIFEIISATKEFFSKVGDEEAQLIGSKEGMMLAGVNPAYLFKQLEACSLVVLQSGSFTPMRDYKTLYGLPDTTVMLDLMQRDIRVIRKYPNQFRAAYISSLTSTSYFRNEELYTRYARVILKLFACVPNHMLVLGSSYEFIEQLENQLQTLSDIPIITESATSRTDALHEKVLAQEERCIILGNQKGKILEGNEWTRDGRSIVSTVVLSGLSTRVPRIEDELILRLRSQIFSDKHKAQLFARQIPLALIAKQALGRTIRHEEDKGAIIILDNRVDKFLQRNLWLYCYSQLQSVIDDLQEFFKVNRL